jgi:hypothetical protein
LKHSTTPVSRRDRVDGSLRKELRPPSTGASEVKMLFAFDPTRQAIFLVAGDKAGNWQHWYTERYDWRMNASLNVKWSDVKAKARALNPRTDVEREGPLPRRASAANLRARASAYRKCVKQPDLPRPNSPRNSAYHKLGSPRSNTEKCRVLS